MNQRMNKPEQKPEDLDIEILVNAVMAAQNACNAASAALRSFLRKRAGVTPGGAPERSVPPTFMARATRMVHQTDTPEGEQNAGQEASGGGDGGRDGLRRESSEGGQDETRGDHPQREDTAGSHLQQD
jgi:hypothetical protein